jgi:hypothetical protein
MLEYKQVEQKVPWTVLCLVEMMDLKMVEMLVEK